MIDKVGRYYLPVPFKEYDNIEYSRKDAYDRFEVISLEIGSFKGKTLIDICCANGFFCFMFLKKGGKEAVGIDIDETCVEFNNTLAKSKKKQFKTYNKLIEDRSFDVGLYLDTHYHRGTEGAGYIEYLKRNCKVVFTSCRERNLDERNQYEVLLASTFNRVERLCAIEDKNINCVRAMYKCY